LPHEPPRDVGALRPCFLQPVLVAIIESKKSYKSNKGFIKNVINIQVLTSKTIRSFNADADVNRLIAESEIPKGKLSIFINEKIRKGTLYEKMHEGEKAEPLKMIIEDVK